MANIEFRAYTTIPESEVYIYNDKENIDNLEISNINIEWVE